MISTPLRWYMTSYLNETIHALLVSIATVEGKLRSVQALPTFFPYCGWIRPKEGIELMSQCTIVSARYRYVTPERIRPVRNRQKSTGIELLLEYMGWERPSSIIIFSTIPTWKDEPRSLWYFELATRSASLVACRRAREASHRKDSHPVGPSATPTAASTAAVSGSAAIAPASSRNSLYLFSFFVPPSLCLRDHLSNVTILCRFGF